MTENLTAPEPDPYDSPQQAGAEETPLTWVDYGLAIGTAALSAAFAFGIVVGIEWLALIVSGSEHLLESATAIRLMIVPAVAVSLLVGIRILWSQTGARRRLRAALVRRQEMTAQAGILAEQARQKKQDGSGAAEPSA